jgi:hypothetical protein
MRQPSRRARGEVQAVQVEQRRLRIVEALGGREDGNNEISRLWQTSLPL